MKNLVFVLATILTVSFLSSCTKERDDISSDEVLIEEITTSSQKQNIDPTELPSNTQAFIADEHFETFVEAAAYVEGKGYEVTLGTEDIEYFNRDGSVLRTDAHPRRCHRPGPCGGGERIAIEELPENISTYIATNYPDQEIRKAKIKGDYYLVGITGPTVLVFDLEGAFKLEAPLFRFCRADRIALENLRENITTYIAENYPDAEIKVAFRVRGKIVVGVLIGDERKALVFNLLGEFLFERP